MRKYKFSNSLINNIEEHEKLMLNEYIKVQSLYLNKFNKFGTDLLIQIFWMDKSKKVLYDRPSISKGYGCYINFDLTKDGKIVTIKDNLYNDGYDDYDLSMSLCVSYTKKHFFDLYIIMLEDISDANKLLEGWLIDLETKRVSTERQ